MIVCILFYYTRENKFELKNVFMGVLGVKNCKKSEKSPIFDLKIANFSILFRPYRGQNLIFIGK